MEMTFRIRLFSPADSDTIMRLVFRLSEFNLPEWRHADHIDNTNVSMMKTAMEEPSPGAAIYVVEDEIENQVVGFICLQTQEEFFSGERQGYISNIAVDKAYEGKGIGKMMLETAEEWAQGEGLKHLTLHVFVENERASQVYEKYGFQKDILKYVKVLRQE